VATCPVSLPESSGAELLEVADRVVVLDQGRVIRDEARVRLAAP